MTHVAAGSGTGGVAGGRGGISVATAIRIAWVSWIVLLIIPFLVFLAMIWRTTIVPSSETSQTGTGWFLASCLYLVVIVPVSFFWQTHVFKSYYTGHTVQPRQYLFGKMTVWIALEIGGLFSLIGCFVENAPLPNLLPALVAFMFFVTFWPNGRAMVRNVGHLEDPQMYEEPR
ncbi:MAG TPA: hypothetical protein VL992_16590 [Tepidisphaeraceae bacterium]|nr:hypothetical protein [Tepidisphaeraceae bacterium]